MCATPPFPLEDLYYILIGRLFIIFYIEINLINTQQQTIKIIFPIEKRGYVKSYLLLYNNKNQYLFKTYKLTLLNVEGANRKTT
jgi:hypothetical protein